MAVHLPRAKRRQREPSGHSRRGSGPLHPDFGERVERLLRPQLGSMIYTMNSMATQLNLQANEPGAFMGLSAMFSGNGFAGMHFKTEAVPKADFDAWAKGTRSGGGPTLSSQVYKELSVQSMNVAPFTYSSVEPGLFHKIVMQELPPGPGPSSKGGF